MSHVSCASPEAPVEVESLVCTFGTPMAVQGGIYTIGSRCISSSQDCGIMWSFLM